MVKRLFYTWSRYNMIQRRAFCPGKLIIEHTAVFFSIETVYGWGVSAIYWIWKRRTRRRSGNISIFVQLTMSYPCFMIYHPWGKLNSMRDIYWLWLWQWDETRVMIKMVELIVRTIRKEIIAIRRQHKPNDFAMENQMHAARANKSNEPNERTQERGAQFGLSLK